LTVLARSSLDYYRNQPGASRLLRVVVTGGGSQLPGLAERLTTLIGVPVELARPRDMLAVGDIGFDDADLPRLDPYLAAPVGLALGAARDGIIIDLAARGRRRAAAGGRGRAIAGGLAAAAVLAALLAIPTLARRNEVEDEKDKTEAAEATNAQLQQQIAALSDAQQKQADLEASQAQLTSLLAGDVSWSVMLQEIARTIPNDVWLTSFSGAVQPGTTGAPTEPGAPAALSGTVDFNATGLEFPSVASWIQRMSEIPSFTDLWVPSATSSDFEGREVVTFTSTAVLTDEAQSDRAEELVGATDETAETEETP
jgi:type IV pilus assembly protein PilM